MLKRPIGEMLDEYASAQALRLHIPGHKGKGREFLLRDVTELSFTDNLRSPTDVISRSEKMYASALSAKYCHYTTGGSSAGLLAFACVAEDKVLVEKHRHVSLTNGLKLFGKKYIEAENEIADDVYMPLTLAQISEFVEKDPEIKSVIMTSPDYYGDAADLKSIYKYLNKRKIKLFVDSAHGAHFGFSKLLPDNASLYCDAAVESTHKTLSALTQTAIVIVNDSALSDSVKQAMNTVTTTSPSFLLLESIENALLEVTSNGKSGYMRLFEETERFRRGAAEYGWAFKKNDDFTRLVIDAKPNGYNGKAVYAALEKRNVFCEFADDRYVVAVLTLADDGKTLDTLLSALKRLQVDALRFDNSYVEKCFG